MLRHWKTLFGEGGVLTSSNREKVGSLVRKLKLGAKAKASLTIFDPDPDTGKFLFLMLHAARLELDSSALSSRRTSGDFEISSLHLLNCSSLLVDGTSLSAGSYPPISSILSQLSILDFTFRYDSDGDQDEDGFVDAFPLNTFGESTPAEVVLGLLRPPWEGLRTFNFQGTVWYDELGQGGSRISFADWSFEILVFEVASIEEREPTERDRLLTRLLLDDVPGEGFLERVKGVELRTDGMIERKLREEVEIRRERVGSLREHEKSMVSLITFVDEAGNRRNLLEE